MASFNASVRKMTRIFQWPKCLNKNDLKCFSVKKVSCKRRSSANSGAWLQRFDDITRVEKSCIVKATKRKKWRKNVVSLQLNMRFSQTWNVWKFAMFKNFMHSQLLKPICLSLNRCETQITKNYQTSKLTFLPWCIITFCSTMNYFHYRIVLIAQCKMSFFWDSGHVIKPTQVN